MPGRSLPVCISLSWRFSSDAAAAPAEAMITMMLWTPVYDILYEGDAADAPRATGEEAVGAAVVDKGGQKMSEAGGKSSRSIA